MAENTFDKRYDAKQACISDKKAVGVKLNHIGLYNVQQSMKGSPFIDGDITKDTWIYLKAYDPHRSTTSLVKVADVKPKIYKRGVNRMIYKLNESTHLKLAHHTCEYLGKQKCRNCSKPEWHAKCRKSIKLLILSYN